MSDPRVEALAAWWWEEETDGRNNKLWSDALAMVDAADPLLPKLRALVEAAQRLSTRWALSGSPDSRAALAAFDAFTADDLARLGITEPVNGDDPGADLVQRCARCQREAIRHDGTIGRCGMCSECCNEINVDGVCRPPAPQRPGEREPFPTDEDLVRAVVREWFPADEDLVGTVLRHWDAQRFYSDRLRASAAIAVVMARVRAAEHPVAPAEVRAAADVTLADYAAIEDSLRATEHRTGDD